MAANFQPTFLLASHSPARMAAIESALTASCALVKVECSAQAALDRMVRPSAPSLALLDAELPGMEMGRLLAATRAGTGERRFPIVLIADSVHQRWLDWLDQGVIEDLIPSAAPSFYWRFRLDMVLRAFARARELQQLREAAALGSQTDSATGIYNRTTLLSILFRETDRVQRMNTPLSMILFAIHDFEHWNSSLGVAACDELLVEVIGRVQRLLRSYDLVGRLSKVEFLLALPGCTSVNAVMLAERVRLEVFFPPFHVAGHAIRLSACFGISASRGRSPVVVVREAEQALQLAKAAGPESIQCASDCPQPPPPPIAFLSSVCGDDPLGW